MSLTLKALHAVLMLTLVTRAGAGGQTNKPSPSLKWGDATVTGFGPFRANILGSGARHFVAIHGKGVLLNLDSPSRGLKANSSKAEGDVDSKEILQRLTLTGGVHAAMVRPSAERSSSEMQTAIADGSEAVYTASDNTLQVTGGVKISDTDPGANRELNASGDSADLVLSPQGSSEQTFRIATLDGHVIMDMKGSRLNTSQKGDTDHRVPFSMHATCGHATFDAQTRTIVLERNVNVTSNELAARETGVDKEVIHLNPDGSVSSVEGNGDPGVTTVDLGSGGR